MAMGMRPGVFYLAHFAFAMMKMTFISFILNIIITIYLVSHYNFLTVLDWTLWMDVHDFGPTLWLLRRLFRSTNKHYVPKDKLCVHCRHWNMDGVYGFMCFILSVCEHCKIGCTLVVHDYFIESNTSL